MFLFNPILTSNNHYSNNKKLTFKYSLVRLINSKNNMNKKILKISVISDIKYFNEKGKGTKQSYFLNKKRESIIYQILNFEIPVYFYKNSKQWFQLKEKLFDTMSEFKINAVTEKGGRLGHDFKINGSIKIDFKFNTKSVTNYPQVIDLKSSKLGNLCYAKFYYNFSNIKAISQKDYLSLI